MYAETHGKVLAKQGWPCLTHFPREGVAATMGISDRDASKTTRIEVTKTYATGDLPVCLTKA